jgi:hypothetical protein
MLIGSSGIFSQCSCPDWGDFLFMSAYSSSISKAAISAIEALSCSSLNLP